MHNKITHFNKTTININHHIYQLVIKCYQRVISKAKIEQQLIETLNYVLHLLPQI